MAGTSGSQDSGILLLADLNYVLDNGCSRSSVGLSKSSELPIALNINLHFQPLDGTLFIHCYGLECQKSNVVLAIFHLPFHYIQGHHHTTSFHVMVVSDHPLSGLDVMSEG